MTCYNHLIKKSSLSYFHTINQKPNYLLVASPPIGKFLVDSKALTTNCTPMEDPRQGLCYTWLWKQTVVLVSLKAILSTWSMIMCQTSKHDCTRVWRDLQNQPPLTWGWMARAMTGYILTLWVVSATALKKTVLWENTRSTSKQKPFLYSWLAACITTRREIKIDKTTALGI